MSVYSWFYTGCETKADLLRAVDLQALRAAFECDLGEACEVTYFPSVIGYKWAILVSYSNARLTISDAEGWLCSAAKALGQAPKVYTACSGRVRVFSVRRGATRTLEYATFPHPDEL